MPATSIVRSGRGLLSQVPELMTQAGVRGRAFVVTDGQVYPHYGLPLAEALSAAGFDPAVHVLTAGEQSKTLRSLELLCDWLAGCKAERHDIVVALGGGVVGDLAGFLAATYLRGMPLVHVPTTLLAQVDSSIGGKTGVNHPRAKNLIGAFHQAVLVAIDQALLDTLPQREFCSGLGEVVKYGVIMDEALFDNIEAHQADLLKLAPEALDGIVARCAALKLDVVGEDEREAGRRTILNFGHTIGHAIEAATNYGALLHGEAISIGMAGAAHIAVELGLFPRASADRMKALLKALGLPIAARGLAWETVREAMTLDKKTTGGKIRWVLPVRLGDVVITADVPDEARDDALREVLHG